MVSLLQQTGELPFAHAAADGLLRRPQSDLALTAANAQAGVIFGDQEFENRAWLHALDRLPTQYGD